MCKAIIARLSINWQGSLELIEWIIMFNNVSRSLSQPHITTTKTNGKIRKKPNHLVTKPSSEWLHTPKYLGLL